MFFTWGDTVRLSREVRGLPPVEVDEELRGWSWREATVASTPKAPLGVSDITSGFCPKGRDVYLRYVKKVKWRDNAVLQRGRLIHEIFSEAVTSVKKFIYVLGSDADGSKLYELMMSRGRELLEGIKKRYGLLNSELIEWLFWRLWGEASRKYSSALDEVKSKSPYLAVESLVAATAPLIPEFPIDGRLIGLSQALRADALLLPTYLVEIKTREFRPEFEASLAGYALAFESQYEIPVDYGVLVRVLIDESRRRVTVRPTVVPVGSKLRLDFLELRDERKELVIYGVDPGVPSRCSPECPYIHYCRGG